MSASRNAWQLCATPLSGGSRSMRVRATWARHMSVWVGAADNVFVEGVSDGDAVDATGSPVHSMRTRWLLLSVKMTFPENP